LPRRNRNAGASDFESMSSAKIKALQEQLAYEWRVRAGREVTRPVPVERW
jgi:hypothetical protein